ncbi:hypothetical protein ACHAXA_004041 [Cyclostephanos tholiformis]|uniref:Protein HIRA-like C-terminal domain-containing protein n=1 Tax=Cyclostephanos tholiformis TaxID=382380 RepID=A0ABD3RDY8_9STRA
MVLAEVPLWVIHGNATTSSDSNGVRTLPEMGFAESFNSCLHSTTASGDQLSAKHALSLLSSTRGLGRAPMYSIDVHPDGTRFATAGGDGNVKIWSMSCLFEGKFNQEDDKIYCLNKKKADVASKFLQDGNYVSSNTEDYFDNSSSSDEKRGHASSVIQKGMLPLENHQVGVNDLSGLVRRKNSSKITGFGCGGGDGGNSQPFMSAVSSAANLSNPLTTLVNFASRSGVGPSSPLSRLTQTTSATAGAATASTIGLDNINDDIFDTAHLNHPLSGHHKSKNHKLLCTIPSHDGSVLSLRFSPSGIYLATAGDDSCVKIFVRSATPSLVKGNLIAVGSGNGDTNWDDGGTGAGDDIEHWNRIAVCRGHHLDVVGLAWAPDDSHLVSCSLDSMHPIIVWRLFDVLHNKIDKEELPVNDGYSRMRFGVVVGNPLRTLSPVPVHYLQPHKILGRNVHTSTVKGVSFDPAGKYLASSGDDPAICIWRAFDDWELEARIDASSGIFRSKKRKRQSSVDHGTSTMIEEEDDPGELASLSLFRRISFAPDGSHVCATNATLRGKNIAAMISREGWMASVPQDGKTLLDGIKNANAHPPPGAANLVGHKQPVVVSRHCPVFFAVPSMSSQCGLSYSGVESEEGDDDGDAEPEYATLIALGDKRGFVTIWSTKSSRPLFKMQCSESRCTVTDISWGVVRCCSVKNDCNDRDRKDSLVMVVSLLDGYIVSLSFDIPTEVGGGSILSIEKTRRIFQCKYGIEDFVGDYFFSHDGQRQPKKRLVDDAGPILIENALQIAMEMEAEAENNGGVESGILETDINKKASQHLSSHQDASLLNGSLNIEERGLESLTEGGEQHICPLTANGASTSISDEDNGQADDADEKGDSKSKGKSRKSLKNAFDAASVAASVADGIASLAMNRGESSGSHTARAAQINTYKSSGPPDVANIETHSAVCSMGPIMRIPCTTSKILSVELTARTYTALSSTVMSSSPLDRNSNKVIADCINSTSEEAPSSSSWDFATITISRGGVKKWMDIIVGTKATAIAANHQLLVVGTSDGRLNLYGTSPTLGWTCCRAYRAFPPFVLGSPVVELNLCDCIDKQKSSLCELVVVTSDGNFFVYSIVTSDKPKLNYKGSIIPAMQHMHLQLRLTSPQPNLGRIQITDSNHLMLILVLPLTSPGRLIWGFIYNLQMELWMCISDTCNFVLSDLYSALPDGIETTQSDKSNQRQGQNDNRGILAKMERIIRSSAPAMASAKQIYQKVTTSKSNNGPTSNDIITRSHCEDRLACSIALGSSSEFKMWLRYYARFLVSSGNECALRFLVDILISGPSGSFEKDSTQPGYSPYFLSIGKETLGLNGKDLVRTAILPECLTSRHLQRLTNEISMELLLE